MNKTLVVTIQPG